jgi:hypothetical protein
MQASLKAGVADLVFGWSTALLVALVNHSNKARPNPCDHGSAARETSRGATS